MSQPPPTGPLLLAALSAVLATASPLLAQEPPWATAVAAAIEARRTADGIPGLSCAIGCDGEIAFARGFGLADLENDVPATAATVYRLASISKPITAVLAMQCAATGELDLDADVATLVPAWPAREWPVTTRQLLAHQGGVRHYQGEAESTRRYRNQTEALERFAADPLRHEPGTKFLYSTYGFNLAAAVIEAVAQQPFAAVVRERIAGPCAAPTLQDDDLERLVRGRAQGYVRRDGELRNSALMDASYKQGGGGLCASAPDLVRFAQALLAGKLVPARTVEAMFAPQALRDGTRTDYGLGFTTGRQDGRRTVGHGGAQSRVSTVLHMLPDDGVVVVLLCNLEGVRLAPLARELAALALPR
ncbi:MAG: beta-lactamase family protein [Planctomycetes bacterium]|nr:beta-lactamase family protein [Planctomycetota bacterium]